MIRSDLQIGLPDFLFLRGKALVVDSDWKDLQCYTEVLRRMGFEVRAFTNYQQASRSLEDGAPDFVLVNQGSAAFEARAIVERAVARFRHTPVVVVTRSLNMTCYLEAMQMGAMDYVEKPLSPAQVEYLVTTYWQPRWQKATQSGLTRSS